MQIKIVYHSCILVLCMLLSVGAFAQAIIMSGKVTDNKGRPLAGVTVRYGKSGKEVTATNSSGIFSVTTTTGTSVAFRLIGYDGVAITARADRNVVIHMKELENQMDEVVVRGYVNRPRETTTGASTKISGKDLQDIPAANVENLLQGKVAGLNIQNNTGAPGFRGSTQIRGLSTLSVSGSGDQSFLTPTSPLYVIDGVPM
ncbi:MAG: carboxypeptidase-like regulatory domain-containing protein, partial [Sphingobacterium siyangense]